MLACTSYSEPRKFLMVRAFAGDSAMTSFLAISVVWVGGGTHRTTRWRVCVKTRVGVYTFVKLVVFWGCCGFGVACSWLASRPRRRLKHLALHASAGPN